jgi:hypothetical protein
MDILEKILKWLSPRDLAILGLTSRTLNFVARNYVSHRCDMYNLRVQVDDFFERNKDLLLPKECALQTRLEINQKPFLLLFSTDKHYLGNVLRVSFNKVDHFAHKKNEFYVGSEWDVALKRSMVVIRVPEAPIHIVHVFNNIEPGLYSVKLRLRMTDLKRTSFQRSNGLLNHLKPPTRLVVSLVPRVRPCHCDDEDRSIQYRASSYHQHVSINGEVPTIQIVEQLISTKNWNGIWDNQHVNQSGPPLLSHATVKYDRDSDWFFFQLDEFMLKTTSNIQVEFIDDLMHEWKRQMIWDFLELRQVVNTP